MNVMCNERKSGRDLRYFSDVAALSRERNAIAVSIRQRVNLKKSDTPANPLDLSIITKIPYIRMAIFVKYVHQNYPNLKYWRTPGILDT
jgi:hypothetical protein